MIFRPFQNLIGGVRVSQAPARPSRKSAATRFRPRIDALEGRTLLSTLVVQNTADSGTGSLRAELGLAQSGDTIKFARGVTGTIALTSGLLEVATNVSIVGPGANTLTISGNNASQVFQVDSGVTASISSLTIANGVAPATNFGSGGGILDLGTLTVSNCVLSNNTTPGGEGGGIEDAGALTVNNSRFVNDTAPNGYGGGIEGDGPLTVTGSTFQNDSALFGGGINSLGTLSVAGSNFSSDAATSGGGGAIAYGPFVPPSTPASITRCTISGNTGGEGGGIYTQANMNVSNSVISNNASPDPTQGDGGGIFAGFGAVLNLSNSTITGNTSTFGGGIAQDQGTLSISNSLIADNTATSSSNFALALGGGLWVATGFSPGTVVSISNSTFLGNQVIGGFADGGAVHLDSYATLTITGSVFDNNVVNGTVSSQGGALDLNQVTQATIKGSSFAGNIAQVPASTPLLGVSGSAGAIDNFGPLTIQNSSFLGNEAIGGPGGGFGVAGAVMNVGFSASLNLSGSTFSGNEAIGGSTSSGFGGIAAGGAFVNFLGATATVASSSFTGNQAIGGSASGAGNAGGLGFGGAIQAEGGTLSISNSQFAANLAVGGAGLNGASGGNGEGGAIENDSGATLGISGGTFSMNVAQGGSGGGNGLGGALYSTNGATATLTSTTITRNVALGGSGGGQGIGGGLYIDPTSGTVTLKGKTKVSGNFASTSSNDIFGTYSK